MAIAKWQLPDENSPIIDWSATARSHFWIRHYFFSYLREVLEIMALMGQYILFFSLKPTEVTSGVSKDAPLFIKQAHGDLVRKY